MDLLSCPRSLYGMQKPCPLPNANSSSGSCRNRVSQGFRGNVRLQPLLNYRVALSNEGEKNQHKPSLTNSGDLAFLEVNQHDRNFITLRIYKLRESTFLLRAVHPSPSGLSGTGTVAAAPQVLALCFSLQRLHS